MNYQAVGADFFQLTTSATCNYCNCNDQVKNFATASVCGKFDTDCDGLIWQDWGQCVLPEGSPCGVGSRSRLRSCGAYTTFDDVKNMCYDPWVKRSPGAGEMAANTNYYQTEACVVQCPVWGPWTPCSAAPGGVGVQMRFEDGNPANQDIRQCSVSSTGPMADKTVDGPCNAACGKGTRQKITYSFTSGTATVVVEECDTGVACAGVASTCPGVDPSVEPEPPVTPVGPVDPSVGPTTEEIITKPATGGNSNTSGVTLDPQPGVDPINPGEVVTAGVKALFGSIVAIIFALML